MNDPLMVRLRREFLALTVNFDGIRYRMHTSGTDKERMGPELRAIFGQRNVHAIEVVNYLHSPERVLREIAHHDEPGNYISLGQSEIPDHTFWACRQMCIALSGMEPVRTCRMFVAELAYATLWNDLTRRRLDPSASPLSEALEMFLELAYEPDDANQPKIRATYDRLGVAYDGVKHRGFVDQCSQPVLVAKKVLGYFSEHLHPLGESFPWFDLMHIVYSRRYVSGPHYALLPAPTITSGDLATIVKMLLMSGTAAEERLNAQEAVA